MCKIFIVCVPELVNNFCNLWNVALEFGTTVTSNLTGRISSVVVVLRFELKNVCTIITRSLSVWGCCILYLAVY